MFVKNNEARIHKIGSAKGQEIVLMPGVNEVDSEAWQAAKEIAVIQGHLKAKTLEEVSGSDGAAEDDVQIDDLKADEAIALVGDTYDRNLLARWKRAEARKTVLEAIDEQLKLVKQDTETK